METIKVYVGENERRKVRYYREFKIVERYEIEEIVENYKVNSERIDGQQGNDKVYDYNYYSYDHEELEYPNELESKDNPKILKTEYIALEKFNKNQKVYEILGEYGEKLNYEYSYLGLNWENELENYFDVEIEKEDDLRISRNYNYFCTDEWKDTISKIDDEKLDDFYTNCGKNGKEYDNREDAEKEVEDLIEYYVDSAIIEANNEEEEYYNF